MSNTARSRMYVVCLPAVALLACAVAAATDLNLAVTSGGNGAVTVVTAGVALPYEVRGTLSDATNEGLAGFLFDLTFSGGPLSAAAAPSADPLLQFARPQGITAAAGFGGAVVSGHLVQVGGAQNTLKNTAGEFPVGTVLTDVGQTEVILATGTFTPPSEPGTYTLSLSNLQATVIKAGQDGSGTVWETEAAGVGTLASLTIEVPPSDTAATASNNSPVCTGRSVTLSGGPAGMASYSWTGPNGFHSSQRNPVVSPAVYGTYTLTITDGNNRISRARTTVTASPLPCEETFTDCNHNGVADACEGAPDCNHNGIPDECDIAAGTAGDCDHNGVPDECQTDSDHDGVIDVCDGCPNDPGKTSPGVCECGTPDTDSDHDGTPDCNDDCPRDPNKTAPGECGCGHPETPDCVDECPDDPDKTSPGVCGCGTPDEDSDGDGTLDCQDDCPDDPNKTARGECGCGESDEDSDSDGTLDCHDGCPHDPRKTAPGECGCGHEEGTCSPIVQDSDGDGVPDSEDGCPHDPDKTAPGACGCGTPDTDTDGDGVPDCIDNCLDVPNADQADANGDGIGDVCTGDAGRTAPGPCGGGACGGTAATMIGLTLLGLIRARRGTPRAR